jgi:hypothetical protein
MELQYAGRSSQNSEWLASGCEKSDPHEFAFDASSDANASGNGDNFDDRGADFKIEQQCLGVADGMRTGNESPNREMTRNSGIFNDDESEDCSEGENDNDNAMRDEYESNIGVESGLDVINGTGEGAAADSLSKFECSFEELGHGGEDRRDESRDIAIEAEDEGETERVASSRAIKHSHEIHLNSTNRAVKLNISMRDGRDLVDTWNFNELPTRCVQGLAKKSCEVLYSRGDFLPPDILLQPREVHNLFALPREIRDEIYQYCARKYFAPPGQSVTSKG